jgi:hypothetical protein
MTIVAVPVTSTDRLGPVPVGSMMLTQAFRSAGLSRAAFGLE